MAPKKSTVEGKIERIASAAKGIVTRQELIRAGISPDEITHRLEIGALIPEHRGVYRVGHRAPNFESSYMAAVKARGKGALLSGRAAAYLLGLIKGKPPPPEVTALPTGTGRVALQSSAATTAPPGGAFRSPPSPAPSSTSRLA